MLPVMETQYKDFSTQEFTFDVCGAPTLIIEAPLTPIAWEKGHYECGQEDNYKWQVTLACFHIKLINRPNIRAFNRQRRARCWECVDERKFLEKTIEYNLNLINENIYEPKNLKNNYLYLLTEEWEEMYIEKKFNKFVWGDGTLLPKIAEILIKRHAFLERNSSYV